jgi:hypothetical protein
MSGTFIQGLPMYFGDTSVNNLTVRGSISLSQSFEEFQVENLTVTGNETVGGELTVNGPSVFNNNVNVNGYLTSTNNLTAPNGYFTGNVSAGTLTSNSIPQMEITYVNLNNNDSSVSAFVPIYNNTNAVVTYSVFPSLYYNTASSSGTYDVIGTSSAMGQIVISGRTATGFTFNVAKSSGENVNVVVVFLVIYNVSQNNTYPD